MVMKLQLNATTRIREVKQQFSAAFPYLKLEFFHNPHQGLEGSPRKEKVPDKAQLIEIRGVLKEGNFLLDPEMTVADFEERMQQKHGLPVQVFRRSGNLWLETVQTDHLSLYTQNDMGETTVKDSSFRFNINTLYL